jgi:hypothetical protein
MDQKIYRKDKRKIFKASLEKHAGILGVYTIA